jgi:hypothetical protein
MNRILWFAVLCLAGLGTAIAIRSAMPTDSPVAKLAEAQTTLWSALTPNEAAKSDRLALPVARAKTETVAPPPMSMPAEAPAEPAASGAIPDWREANAKDISAEDISAEDISAKDISAKDISAQNTLAKDTSAKDTSATASSAAPSRRLPKSRMPKRRLTEHHRPPTEHVTTDHSENEKPRAAFRCRQDAVGGLLRSLDLSPRCDL